MDDDDFSCVEYILDQFLGVGQIKFEAIMERIRNSESAEKFRVVEKYCFDSRCLDNCIQEVKSGFVMKVGKNLPVPRIIKRSYRI